MILFKQRILTAAVATTLSLGIATNAHAGAMSFSNLSFSNFTLTHSEGVNMHFLTLPQSILEIAPLTPRR